MSRCRSIPAALAALALCSSVVAADIPCTCRFDGRSLPEGSTVCIDLSSGRYLARCERVLNNTAWVRVAEACPGLS